MPPEPRHKKNQLRLTNTPISSPVRVSGKRAKRLIANERADGAVGPVCKHEFNAEEEERIANTIRYKETIEPEISLRKVAEKFEVCHVKLHRRIKGTQNRLNCGGRNTLLTDEQETAIFQILD